MTDGCISKHVILVEGWSRGWCVCVLCVCLCGGVGLAAIHAFPIYHTAPGRAPSSARAMGVILIALLALLLHAEASTCPGGIMTNGQTFVDYWGDVSRPSPCVACHVSPAYSPRRPRTRQAKLAMTTTTSPSGLRTVLMAAAGPEARPTPTGTPPRSSRLWTAAPRAAEAER